MMRWNHALALALPFCCFIQGEAQQREPLKLITAFSLPSDVKGHFDHFGVDVVHHRLFATPEDYKSVLVLDLSTGKLLHRIDGIGRPHAILYREDLNRIYVTDGGAGALKIFDGTNYALVKTVKLLVDADSIGYDPVSKFLYVDNGGGDAHQDYSMLSVIDTTAGKKVADIKIDGDTLEAMALEKSGPKLYVNNRAKNQVDVIDRQKRTLTQSWPITKGKVNVAMAFDEPNHRLFVGCRSGEIVVLNTENGQELQALPISTGIDDLAYDAGSRRLYAACDGFVNVFQQKDADHYEPLAKVSSGPSGKTARLVPEMNQYFIAVPAHGATSAEVLVYKVQ